MIQLRFKIQNKIPHELYYNFIGQEEGQRIIQAEHDNLIATAKRCIETPEDGDWIVHTYDSGDGNMTSTVFLQLTRSIEVPQP